MLLAININNTETKVGLFRGDSLESHWRLTTTPQRTPDEWASTLTSYLAQAGRSTQEVRAAIVASVVPPVTQGLCEAVERATTVVPAVVDGRSKLPITLDVEEPLQVGADKALNCFFPMPYAKHARITVTNEGAIKTDAFYFNIDYRTYSKALPADSLYFHAQYRQSAPAPLPAAGGALFEIGDHPFESFVEAVAFGALRS